jgi:hypothetical protein
MTFLFMKFSSSGLVLVPWTSANISEEISVHGARMNLLRIRSTADLQRFVRQAPDASSAAEESLATQRNF